jgi:cysteine desulfuration protein SufE
MNAAASLQEKQNELAGALARCRTPEQRLTWLVEQARARGLLEPELRTDEHRVAGCLSRLWLVPQFRDGRCWFRCDSDSLIVKAVAGLLCDFYSGAEPAAILAHDPAFLGKLGITQHLTPNRRNGLASVWKIIRDFAAAHLDDKAAGTAPAGG